MCVCVCVCVCACVCVCVCARWKRSTVFCVNNPRCPLHCKMIPKVNKKTLSMTDLTLPLIFYNKNVILITYGPKKACTCNFKSSKQQINFFE